VKTGFPLNDGCREDIETAIVSGPGFPGYISCLVLIPFRISVAVVSGTAGALFLSELVRATIYTVNIIEYR
jgi:hypothetical protein